MGHTGGRVIVWPWADRSWAVAAQVRKVSGTGDQRADRAGYRRGDDLGTGHPDRGPDRSRRPLRLQRARTATALHRLGDRLQARLGGRSRTDAPEGVRGRIALEPDIFKLEEVVVTGQSTGIERQNLPNAVATVSGERARPGRPPARSRARCRARSRARYIQANSGAPGGGMQVNLRGVSTINGERRPALRGGRRRGQQRRDPQRGQTR